jgi:hypothetical protein
MVIALIALAVALSGTAVAAAPMITGQQIKDHSIGMVDISTLAVAKLRGLRGAEGVPGAVGPEGPIGPVGPAGVNGGFDPAKVTQVVSPVIQLGSGAVGSTSVACPPGTKLLGGGAVTTGESLWATRPSGDGWFGGAIGYGFGIGGTLYVVAVCGAP